MIDAFDPYTLCVPVRELPSEEVLQQMVDYWKEQLGLQAWDIKAVHAKTSELDKRNRGCTRASLPDQICGTGRRPSSMN